MIKRNSAPIRLYKKTHHTCEICGSTEDLHVHHIVPLSVNGADSVENLQMLCRKCHKKLHRGDCGELVKVGMRSARETPKAPLIDYYELQKRIFLEDPMEVSEVIDIINHMPMYYRGGRTLQEAYDDAASVIKRCEE